MLCRCCKHASSYKHTRSTCESERCSRTDILSVSFMRINEMENLWRCLLFWWTTLIWREWINSWGYLNPALRSISAESSRLITSNQRRKPNQSCVPCVPMPPPSSSSPEHTLKHNTFAQKTSSGDGFKKPLRSEKKIKNFLKRKKSECERGKEGAETRWKRIKMMMMKVQKKAENCEKVFDIFQCYTYCMRRSDGERPRGATRNYAQLGIGSFHFELNNISGMNDGTGSPHPTRSRTRTSGKPSLTSFN